MNLSNRPRRAEARPGESPNPAEFRAWRRDTGMTQAEVGALVYRSERTVQDWESGARCCPPDTWLFLQLLWGFPAVERARDEWLASFAGR